MKIGEFLSAFFQYYYCPAEAKATLKQSCFVNDILASSHRSIRHFILCCQNQTGERRFSKHIRQNVPDRMSSPRADFIRFDAIAVLLGKMVFKISPQRASPVADKNDRRWVYRLWWFRGRGEFAAISIFVSLF